MRPIEGEEYRFLCPSDKFAAQPYLVDLESHGGRGECACKFWTCKCHPAMKQGETDVEILTCKHQQRCLLFWAKRELVKRLDSGSSLVKELAEPSLLRWAFNEIRKQVRAKRKLNNGKREDE